MTHSKNPILTWRQNPRRDYDQTDQNWLNCLRFAEDWVDPTPNSYRRNKVVFHEGALWINVEEGNQNEPTRELGVGWRPVTLVPGRGGMALSTPTTSVPDIGAGWNPLTYYDEVSLQPYGVVLDTIAGTWGHNFSGIWSESLFFGFQHDSSNQGRLTYLRLWDITAGVELGRTPVGIGRNVEATNFSVTIYTPILSAQEGNLLRWEIGGGSSIAVDSWDNLRFDTIQVSVI